MKFLLKKTDFFKNCVKTNNLDSIKHFEQTQDALRKNIEISKRKLYSELSRVLATNNKTNPKYYGL